MKHHTIVGLGEILWDVFPQGKRLGGAPANFAFHASQFGHRGVAVSAIGKDKAGQEIMEELKHTTLQHLICETDYPTGTVMVNVDERGIPHYEITENVAWDNIPFTPEMEQLAQQTDVVVFGSLAKRNSVSKATIHCFLETMPAHSLKVFDINLRLHYYSRELVEESLRLANILKLNDEEVKLVATLLEIPHTDEIEICNYLRTVYRLDIVIFTKGTDGSYVFRGSETSFQPTPLVQVADTVGAGDSFTGAFIGSLLNGKTLSEAHRRATQVAAYVCTQHGAMPLLHDELRR